MSEDSANEFTLPEEDIRRAFKEMGAVRNCPICDHHTWHIISGEDEYPAVALFTKKSGLDFQVPNIPVTMLFCGQCFFLRMHPTKALMQWLEQNPKRSESGEDEGNGAE